MIVEIVDVPVCKPCPKCGMPDIIQYEIGDKIRFSLTCKNRCIFIGHECKDLNDAIKAWNMLIEGPEKPPEVKVPTIQYQVVQYERKVQPVKKVAGIVATPRRVNPVFEGRMRMNAKKEAYYKIAQHLFEEGVGFVEYSDDVIMDCINTRVTIQVIDDR